MRKAWFVLGGFMLGVVITSTVGPRFGRAGRQTGPAQVSQAERELGRNVRQIDLNEVPFDRAVADVRKLTMAKIEVDDKALADAGLDRTAPVTMHGSDVPLEQILERLIGHGANGTQLAYGVRDGRIIITTEEKLAREPFVRIYDVRDVLSSSMLVPDPDGDRVQDSPPPPPPPPGLDEKSRAQALIRLIEDTIAVDSWSANGGSVGAMGYCGGRLVVAQTWTNHRLLAKLLDQLREPEAPAPPPIQEKPWSRVHHAWIALPEIERQETAIRKPIASIALDQVPFDQAVETLRTLSGVNIWVDWPSLALEDFVRNTPVSLRLTHVTLSEALDRLLSRPVGAVELGYGVEDGVVLITTRQCAGQYVITRAYDVRDMILPIGTPGRADGIDALIRYLTRSVDPDSWKDNGGVFGKIQEVNGRLIVTQSWQSHEKIARWLDMLRDIGWNVAAAAPERSGNERAIDDAAKPPLN